MGMHYYVFVGPYVRCKNPAGEETTSMRTCSTKTCHKHGRWPLGEKSLFCNECGAEIEDDVSITRACRTVDINEVYEDLDDRLHTIQGEYGDDGTDLWVSNRGGEHFGQTYERNTDTPDEHNPHPETEMEAFRTEFEDELQQLEAAYGDDEVEVRWGAIPYYN